MDQSIEAPSAAGLVRAYDALMARDLIFDRVNEMGEIAGRRMAGFFGDGAVTGVDNGLGIAFAGPSYDFCIPPNPLLKALRLEADLNLYKLRSCRNIAGMERELEPYSAPTDTSSGLPAISGGRLVLPGAIALRPTVYRYAFLVERAKQLAQMALQIESAMLTALERRDAELFQVLDARNSIELARAGVRLQALRVREAESGIKLAQLQQDRATLQAATYQQWLDAGMNQWEEAQISAFLEAESARIEMNTWDALTTAAQALTTAATAGLTAAGAFAGAAVVTVAALERSRASTLLAKAETSAQIASVNASYERRAEEWTFQKALALHDESIGAQQVRMAEDAVRVVGQERVIAELQAGVAKDTLDFLTTKFTNVELYDWMSGVLGDVYASFLQQATAVAKLAENQLAFERQEPGVALIQTDYWEGPPEEAGPAEAQAPDRRGLTGSARLLRDIHELDQRAFDTHKRKLHLTKIVSLARLAPAEFQRFRETGVIRFDTTSEMFDRDFPGHYLRLIHRVRSSVIALIPPSVGIHATLSTTGLSRVAADPDRLEPLTLRRDPEAVALTSPRDATGIFELEAPPEILLPFEGNGVDTGWEFSMPKAANLFNYGSIADILITIEYTALASFNRRLQVIRALDPSIGAERSFSFRHQFADQWYDLNNPDQTATPMTVRFKTTPADFPPNLRDLAIRHLLLYFSRAPGSNAEVHGVRLGFRALNDAWSADTVDGLISTRRANGSAWMQITNQGPEPFGDWELSLVDTPELRALFSTHQIEDILFVLTYSGRTAEWPT
jgi:hypothetical protein